MKVCNVIIELELQRTTNGNKHLKLCNKIATL